MDLFELSTAPIRQGLRPVTICCGTSVCVWSRKWRKRRRRSIKDLGLARARRAFARRALARLETREPLAVSQKFEPPNRLATYPVRLQRAC